MSEFIILEKNKIDKDILNKLTFYYKLKLIAIDDNSLVFNKL